MALIRRITTQVPLLYSTLPPSSSFSPLSHSSLLKKTISTNNPLSNPLKKKEYFASDNAASVHSHILSSLCLVASQGECVGYGFDSYTNSVKNHVCEYFECPEAQVEFTYGGTGGNMCVMSLLRKGEAIAATTCAHIYDDEAGGPEFGGNKIYPVNTNEGKMDYEDLVEQVQFAIDGGFHRAPVKMVSITQPTERGTVYSLEEIQKISQFCRENDLILHMDGARIGNALPHLNCTMADMTHKSGVDIMTFGGTKHGLIYGEAIVLFNNKTQTPHFIRLQKMLGQKSSKERFIAAQFRAMLSDSFLENNCQNAVKMASLIKKGIEEIDTNNLIGFNYPVQANVLFPALPPPLLSHLQKTFQGVEEWEREREEEGGRSIVRVMTSFSTTEEKVEEFLGAIREWYAENQKNSH